MQVLRQYHRKSWGLNLRNTSGPNNAYHPVLTEYQATTEKNDKQTKYILVLEIGQEYNFQALLVGDYISHQIRSRAYCYLNRPLTPWNSCIRIHQSPWPLVISDPITLSQRSTVMVTPKSRCNSRIFQWRSATRPRKWRRTIAQHGRL